MLLYDAMNCPDIMISCPDITISCLDTAIKPLYDIVDVRLAAIAQEPECDDNNQYQYCTDDCYCGNFLFSPARH